MRISPNYFNLPINRTNFSDPITKLLNIFERTGPKNQQILNYSARATSNLTDNNNVCKTIQTNVKLVKCLDSTQIGVHLIL